MYTRSYRQSDSGAVRAFEEAYAKEDFLRRSSSVSGQSKVCGGEVLTERTADDGVIVTSECGCLEKTPPGAHPKSKSSFSGIFGDADGGDIILLLLIILFLFDRDSENDVLIPLLLAVLLAF